MAAGIVISISFDAALEKRPSYREEFEHLPTTISISTDSSSPRGARGVRPLVWRSQSAWPTASEETVPAKVSIDPSGAVVSRTAEMSAAVDSCSIDLRNFNRECLEKTHFSALARAAAQDGGRGQPQPPLICSGGFYRHGASATDLVFRGERALAAAVDGLCQELTAVVTYGTVLLR